MKLATLALLILCAGCLPSKDMAATDCANAVIKRPNWTQQEFDSCYTDRGLDPPGD